MSLMERAPEGPKVVTEDVVKILVVGGQRAGRSAVIRRYVFDVFTGGYFPTIGVDLTAHKLGEASASKVSNEIWVEFWNIASQEIRGKNLSNYLKDTQGVIIVFDCTDLKSIKAVDEWRLVIDQFLGLPNPLSDPRKTTRRSSGIPKPIPMILLANKRDLGKSVIKTNDLDLYAKKSGYLSWHLTSARDGSGVKEAIDSLLETVVDTIAYQKLEERCNRKLAKENHRRLSNTMNFTTQNIYENFEIRRSSSPNLAFDNESISGFSSRSTSPTRSELDIDPESLSLRDLEMKGNNFYLNVSQRLSVLMSYADPARLKDLEQLENQRAAEYSEFRRKFLEVASCMVNFSPTIFEPRSPSSVMSAEVSSPNQDYDLYSMHTDPGDVNYLQAAQLFSAINVFLIESNRRWEKVLDQLDTEISLTLSFDPSSSPEFRPSSRTPTRSRSPGSRNQTSRESPPESLFRRYHEGYSNGDDEPYQGDTFRSQPNDLFGKPSRHPIRRGFSEENLQREPPGIRSPSQIPRHRSLGFGFRNSKIGSHF